MTIFLLYGKDKVTGDCVVVSAHKTAVDAQQSLNLMGRGKGFILEMELQP